jgi:hypothetical protein
LGKPLTYSKTPGLLLYFGTKDFQRGLLKSPTFLDVVLLSKVFLKKQFIVVMKCNTLILISLCVSSSLYQPCNRSVHVWPLCTRVTRLFYHDRHTWLLSSIYLYRSDIKRYREEEREYREQCEVVNNKVNFLYTRTFLHISLPQ